jgi:FlgD Ig-like domain
VDESATRRAAAWTSIGPDNVGGRMLSLAIDPTNSSRVWAGAASGGLWLSTNGAEGATAWTRQETGYPTLSVSAIVIDPTNTDRMVIGTGEISRYERPLNGTPGARSSYGMGILRSTDGGSTWNPTNLTWTFDQSRAVLAIRNDPSNPSTLWAATSEGLYKSTDAGATWAVSLSLLMTMDVAVDPTNGSVVYATAGQLGVPDDTQAGIWKTTNGGSSWTRLGGGLPTTDFGRTPIVVSADGTRVYAGVSDAVSRQVVGLYRSTNGGSTWSNMSSTNWANAQAWYDNTIAVSPADRDVVLCGGLDMYRTSNGGSNLNDVTAWYLGYDGVVPAGGPEGPSDYVHADQHAITFDPDNSDVVYVACDGGIFKSTDRGVTWGGKNGNLRTTQIYNGLGIGTTTVDLALAGLQDNGTIKYTGADSWSKVFGGDGGWCAIQGSDEDVLYEEYVYLNMYKSTDGGTNWDEVHPGSSGSANFIAPFVLAPSNASVLYGGTRSVHKSTNGGNSWFYPDGDSNWNGTPVATIGVAPTDENYVMAGTGDSGSSPVIEFRRTTNGGSSWADVTAQFPDRYPTDFTYDGTSRQRVWATVSGYGTGHVFRSTDAGLTWSDASGNLPDIPAQSIASDPVDPDWAYVGTDLGIYRTTDGGASWTDFNAGIPTAMILDVVIHPATRRMRAATFGNGVWEIDLPSPATAVAEVAPGPGAHFELVGGTPNPFRAATTVRFSLTREAPVSLTVHDAGGRLVRTLVDAARPAGSSEAVWDGRDGGGREVAAGVYFVRLVSGAESRSSKLTFLR